MERWHKEVFEGHPYYRAIGQSGNLYQIHKNYKYEKWVLDIFTNDGKVLIQWSAAKTIKALKETAEFVDGDFATALRERENRELAKILIL